MRLSEAALRRLVRETLRAVEWSNELSKSEMVTEIERALPDFLRGQFPGVGFEVRRAGHVLRPFDLVRVFAIHPPVFVSGNSIILGLHLGDGFDEQRVPSSDEVARVVNRLESWFEDRGWNLWMNSMESRGERLRIELLPLKSAEVEVPHVLYHITDAVNVPSIRAGGLAPRRSKGGERRYSERVHLFTRRDVAREQIAQNAEAHGGELWYAKMTASPDVVVVEIDPTRMGDGAKFYLDPEFGDRDEGAVYTTSLIPPRAIGAIYPASEL